MFYGSRYYWKRLFSILFSFKNKVYVLCDPTHSNLGDQAQLMCTDKWIRENYPNYKIIHLGIFKPTLNLVNGHRTLLTEFSYRITLGVLRLKMKKEDFLLGHSGYFMVDHHNGWKMFTDMMHYFPNNKMVIFPQTINFHTPVIKRFVSNCFSKSKNVTLMCRDKVSYEKAKEMFPTTPLLLYPDIVTSLIGTKHFDGERDGVLFCMRDDIEAFYSVKDIDALIARFGDIRKEKVDTTINGLTREDLDKEREKIIFGMIAKFASYKVVITDRYHGTIFSAIAGTPVVVINSADHKLSSGVNWFPKEVYKDAVQFAENLDDAYAKASSLLQEIGRDYNNPSYFKDNYWDVLKDKLKN
jgi:exopolysaccharide biosynthesis predicted pyruvyltransferase EpsI